MKVLFFVSCSPAAVLSSRVQSDWGKRSGNLGHPPLILKRGYFHREINSLSVFCNLKDWGELQAQNDAESQLGSFYLLHLEMESLLWNASYTCATSWSSGFPQSSNLTAQHQQMHKRLQQAPGLTPGFVSLVSVRSHSRMPGVSCGTCKKDLDEYCRTRDYRESHWYQEAIFSMWDQSSLKLAVVHWG